MGNFELLLFSTDTDYIQKAVEAGIDGIVVDREHLGKGLRQRNLDTQINLCTVEDLRRVRASVDAPILCRVNNIPGVRNAEVAEALTIGVDEILLPMVRSIDEVKEILLAVGDRARVGILVETDEAISIASQLAQLPLSRVFVGLNDLALQHKTTNIFESVRDGTVETLREKFADIPFGFGGLTLPPYGIPIPTILLMAEMIRLSCNFTFLRRSFLRDVPQVDLPSAVKIIHNKLQVMLDRTAVEISTNHMELMVAIAELNEGKNT